MHGTRRSAIGAMVLAVVGLSFGSTLVKKSGLAGPVAAFWRLLFGTLIWHGIVFANGLRTKASRVLPAIAWKRSFLPGIAFGINLAFFYTAVTKTSIAHTEFIGATTPLLVIPFAKRRLGERVPNVILAFAGLAFVGIGFVIFSGAAKTSTRPNRAGDLLVVGAVVLWAAYLLQSKSVRAEVSTVHFMTGMTSAAFVALAPVALWRAGSLQALTNVSARGWTMVVLMSITSGLISHGLIAWAQKTIPVSTISIMQVAQPGMATFWAWLFLSQNVSGKQVIGMAIVMFAIGNVAWRSAQPTR